MNARRRAFLSIATLGAIAPAAAVAALRPQPKRIEPIRFSAGMLWPVAINNLNRLAERVEDLRYDFDKHAIARLEVLK